MNNLTKKLKESRFGFSVNTDYEARKSDCGKGFIIKNEGIELFVLPDEVVGGK